MRLIYKGTISEDEANWCKEKLHDYPYAIELKRIPEHQKLTSVLKQHTWYKQSDLFDSTTEMRSILYGIVQKNFMHGPRDENGYFIGECFIFLKDREDYDAFVENFDEIIINKDPFMVSIETKHDYGTTADGEVFNHEEVGETSWIDRKIFRRKKYYRVRYICHIGGSYHVSTEFFDEKP